MDRLVGRCCAVLALSFLGLSSGDARGQTGPGVSSPYGYVVRPDAEPASTASGSPFPSANLDAGAVPSVVPSAAPPVGTFVDLDVQATPRSATTWIEGEPWSWTVLPTSIIYKSYLAGTKESRLASQHVYNKHIGWLWEPTLGARVGVLRFGSDDPVLPQGWQFDIEGSAQARLSVPDDVDVVSTDYRAGFLLTRGDGPFQTKFGYYHLSSHLGDEFLLDNVGYPRLNYVRDALVLGQSYYATEQIRLYAEATWAFNHEYAKPWEFQFGVDVAPALPTGVRGAPFFAINGYLREEVDFGGTLVVQTGWAWRGDESGRLLRFGLHYTNGKSTQFSFYQNDEEEIGFGLWYDF